MLQAFKEALIAFGQYTPRSHRSSEPEEMIDVKIYTQLTAAGTGNYIDDDHFGIISFPISKVPEDTDFGIRISGDSMAPRYVNKQIAMVEQCHELYSGEIGIFIYDGQSYIKEYHESEPSKEEIENYLDSNGCLHPKITLISLNKEYENIEVKPDRPFYIVGCEKICPFHNIKLTDKKPIWNRNCTHCMACIGSCPTEAIEYGKHTKGLRRYYLR